MIYELAADFETTTQADDCRVWSWGLCHVYDLDDYVRGTTIDGFFERLLVLPNKSRIWFHNLGFDGRFIVYHLLAKLGYEHTNDKDPLPGTFSSLIDDLGKWYQLRVNVEGKVVTFADSFKKFPFKLATVATTYGLEFGKGSIDYDAPRPEGYEPTPEEWDYLKRDVLILAMALQQRLEMGNRLTTGADCLELYREDMGRSFNRFFPQLNPKLDKYIRSAYRGGYVYVAPDKRELDLMGPGVRLDVNSLYPWAMHSPNPYPVGLPRHVGRGCALPDTGLWVAEVTFSARLKPGALPCIQPKASILYTGTEYIERTYEPLTMGVCSVDWTLWNMCYDIDLWDVADVYAFDAEVGLFDDYIDRAYTEKAAADNPGQRMNWKLRLNNLYGKFGQKSECGRKVPTYDPVADVVRYVMSEDTDSRDPVYIPVAVFVTAYARSKVIADAMRFGNRFCYCDTDSIHAIGIDIPEGVDVHPTELGAWKLEATWEKARFLRAKTYAEVVEGVAEYTCSGMSDGLKGVLRYDDFRVGFTTDPSEGCTDPLYLDENIQKLLPVNVPGGVTLKPVPFSIR